MKTKRSNGGSINRKRNEGGFSLIEVMVTLLICSILLAIVSQNFSGIQRSVRNFTHLANYREQYIVFLLKFEEDFYRSELLGQSNISSFEQLQFAFDLNEDGDWSDSGERIAYRWNLKEQRIDRKSGDGYFQALLDGVSGFSWERTGTSPLCFKMTVQNSYSQTDSKTFYCRTITPDE